MCVNLQKVEKATENHSTFSLRHLRQSLGINEDEAVESYDCLCLEVNNYIHLKGSFKWFH